MKQKTNRTKQTLGGLLISMTTLFISGCLKSPEATQSGNSQKQNSPDFIQSAPQPGDPQALMTFTKCVSASGTGTICELPSGLYLVPDPINVQRSNITIRGAGGGQSVLQRGSTSDQVMMVGSRGSAPITGISIENLVFDGNSPKMTCPNGNCVDLWVQNTCATPASCKGNVTANGAPYSVTIRGCEFKNAPAHAVAFYSDVNNPSNDILFVTSSIHDAVVTGLLVGGGGDVTYQQCDNGTTSPWIPSNITVDQSSFIKNHTGAFGVNASRYFNLTNSTFSSNYWNPIPSLPAGGTVFFDQCSDFVNIIGNDFAGPTNNPSLATGGLELWGRNTLVKKNAIHDFPTDGVGANSVYNLRVTENSIYNNNRFSTVNSGWRSPGITIWNRRDHRLTNGVIIDHNNVYNDSGFNTQTYGVRIEALDNPNFTISNITVTADNDFSRVSKAPFCQDTSIIMRGTNSIAFPSDCEGILPHNPPPSLPTPSPLPAPIIAPSPGPIDKALRDQIVAKAGGTTKGYNWDEWNYFYSKTPNPKLYDPTDACVSNRKQAMSVDIFVDILSHVSVCGGKKLNFTRNTLAIVTDRVDGYKFDEWNYFYKQVTGTDGPTWEKSGVTPRTKQLSLDVYTAILSNLGY